MTPTKRRIAKTYFSHALNDLRDLVSFWMQLTTLLFVAMILLLQLGTPVSELPEIVQVIELYSLAFIATILLTPAVKTYKDAQKWGPTDVEFETELEFEVMSETHFESGDSE